MPTKQYVKKLNGFYVKDEDARNDIDEVSSLQEADRADIDTLKSVQNTYKLGYTRIGRYVEDGSDISAAAAYRGMQGGVMDSDSTLTYIANHFDATGAADSETCLIKRINLNTGDVILSKEVELEHGNNIAFDRINNVYYVTPAHKMTEGQEQSFKIIKLDAQFNVLDTAVTQKNYDSISVDENGNIYAGFTYKGSQYAFHVYKLNAESFAEESDIELELTDTSNFVGQGFAVYGGKIYVIGSYPSIVDVFKLDGTSVKNYWLEDYDIYTIGETENISTWDGKNFVIGSVCQYDLNRLTQFFATNLSVGTTRKSTRGLSVNEKGVSNYYIDCTNTEWNPDGTNAHPFSHLAEATCIAKGARTIAIKTAGTYYINKIEGVSADIYASNQGTGVVISCGNASGIEINHGKIEFNSVGTIPAIFANKNSEVFISSCTLAKSNSEYLCKSDQNSVLSIKGCTFDTTETYSDAYFYANRGLIRYYDGNTSIANKTDIGIIFRGPIWFYRPVELFHGSIAKGSSVSVNGPRIVDFKEIRLRFTDAQEMVIPGNRNQLFNATFSNFSTAGTGNNAFWQVALTVKADGTIEFTKANKISFAADGTMTIDTAPDFKITNVFVAG